MAEKTFGKCIWFFPDGDLPQPGDSELEGHEALIILNPNDADAQMVLTVYYEDKDPDTLEPQTVAAQRVKCIRLDKPIGGYKIPFGQYAMKAESTVPVICQFGRLDVTQPNLAYYIVPGLAY